MLPSYGCDSYALKQYLSGEALMVVKGVDNDDLKYDRPDKTGWQYFKRIKRAEENSRRWSYEIHLNGRDCRDMLAWSKTNEIRIWDAYCDKDLSNIKIASTITKA